MILSVQGDIRERLDTGQKMLSTLYIHVLKQGSDGGTNEGGGKYSGRKDNYLCNIGNAQGRLI